MVGYRVSARIDGGTPHRLRPPAPAAGAPREGDDVAPVDLVGRPLEAVLAERLAAFRERWAQTTFFLFDPESWRT
jgi:hypothetical protein